MTGMALTASPPYTPYTPVIQVLFNVFAWCVGWLSTMVYVGDIVYDAVEMDVASPVTVRSPRSRPDPTLAHRNRAIVRPADQPLL